jgi:hypothetical protein
MKEIEQETFDEQGVSVKAFKEVMENEQAFPNARFIDSATKEKMFNDGTALTFYSIKELESATGAFCVVLAKTAKGEMVSFSIGGVVASQLCKIKDKFPVLAFATTKKSKDGKVYYTLE